MWYIYGVYFFFLVYLCLSFYFFRKEIFNGKQGDGAFALGFFIILSALGAVFWPFSAPTIIIYEGMRYILTRTKKI